MESRERELVGRLLREGRASLSAPELFLLLSNTLGHRPDHMEAILAFTAAFRGIRLGDIHLLTARWLGGMITPREFEAEFAALFGDEPKSVESFERRSREEGE